MDQQATQRIKDSIAFERDRKAPPEDFPALPDIPVGRYTDPEFWALEVAGLWQRSWLYAAHDDELPNPGDYYLWERGSAPIFLIRGNDGEVRAFYNTCRHRGAPIVEHKSGNSPGLMCKYHGWTYNLQGDLINLRDRRDFVDLDMSCRGLYPVRCERFGRWLFVNEDPDAEPLLESLGPIVDEFAQMQPENLRFVERHGFEIRCNVKVMMDAFLEVYHLKSIHQNTVDRFLDHRGSLMTLWKNGHSRMITPWRREGWVDPGTIGMKEIDTVTEIPRSNNCSYNLYPNLVTPIDVTGVPILTFWPVDIETMYVECAWFTPDLNGEPLPELWKQRIANFDAILAEDTQFAPRIQKSMRSKAFKGMPLNYQERRIYHWHEELDRRIGADRIPEHLRVPPRLSGHVEN
jgi:phenylpropionate dioxygenase-like ring-hydroxylating dioxygenase large terminal subunit